MDSENNEDDVETYDWELDKEFHLNFSQLIVWLVIVLATIWFTIKILLWLGGYGVA